MKVAVVKSVSVKTERVIDMDLDVVRVVEFQLESVLKEMKEAKSITELNTLYNEAEDNLEDFFNALKAKFDE